LVAVKNLNTATSRNLSDAEFIQKVSTISKFQHENVVKLIGYCSEHKQRLLIYEYCANGTLHDALHSDHETHKKLSWDKRIKITLGAARALMCLHESCSPPVVHKSFRSTNILLDDNFEPKISDSGLITMFSDGFPRFDGTGYDAPELELGAYTKQSDVFSFGVIMLELLTGRKPYDRLCPRGEQLLVRWAIPRLHDINALYKMVDPSLEGAYSSKSLSRLADIISLCIQASSSPHTM
ncbi:STRUBBELIG-RECEPTOR FAMILY 3-like protein, partial [Drosera capensis]